VRRRVDLPPAKRGGISNMTNHKRWRASEAIQQRTKELRREQTPAEQKLWARLRGKQLLGFKSRRQHPIGRFIVDFCCARSKLVIEIDGDSHAVQVEYDDSRTAHLEEIGYTVVRFTNEQVHRHLDAVLTEIVQILDRLDQTGPSSS